MNVVVCAGGRFHALQLAQQLHKRGMLKKLLTGGYAKRDLLPSCVVERHIVTELLDSVSYRFPLYSAIDQQTWYRFKDAIFESWAVRKLRFIERADIFVGWAHYCGNNLSAIKQLGAKIVLESGSCHIIEQNSILKSEFESFGLSGEHISPAIVEKVVREYDYADYIMTPARHVVKSFIKHGVDEKKLLCVPYGVDVAKFVPKSEFNPRAKFRVIFVGNVGLQKGVHYLLYAWNKAALPVSDSELCIVGTVLPHFKKLMPQLPKNENVKFVGAVAHDKLTNLYLSADLFVLPSVQEGLAMVQAEAMASGLPVLCTDRTGGDELINHGEHGFIVSARNAGALAEKIVWCYEHRRDAYDMGQNGASRISRNTWDHYGSGVVANYHNILGYK